MILPGRDGVDHLNIYSRGETKLGRWMSNFTKHPFVHPQHGPFDSVEGYWYWLSTYDERLRKLSGFQAKKLGKSLPRQLVIGFNTEVFKNLIREAITAKLNTPPLWSGLLRQCTLPFCHYYVFNGRAVDAGYQWIVDHWDFLRKLHDNPQ